MTIDFVDFPMHNGDFLQLCNKLPEGTPLSLDGFSKEIPIQLDDDWGYPILGKHHV